MMCQSEGMMKIFVVIYWLSPRRSLLLSVSQCRRKDKETIVLGGKQ